MQEISAAEAADLLRRNPESTLLLDVREPAELAAAAVAGALHIPMGEIPARLSELDRDKTIVCMCHLGGRSAQVTAFLASQGFPDVMNMAGGIEAWADDVDPAVRR
jgi:rhodanese-related sulfurtransferase